jgi:cell division protein FtsB
MTKRNRRHHAVKRRRRISWALVMITGGFCLTMLIGSLFFDDMGIRKYVGMLKHARQLEKDVLKLERQNAELRTDIYRIQHDPDRIEELARERLGLVKKGDTVYQLVTEPEKGNDMHGASRR